MSNTRKMIETIPAGKNFRRTIGAVVIRCRATNPGYTITVLWRVPEAHDDDYLSGYCDPALGQCPQIGYEVPCADIDKAVDVMDGITAIAESRTFGEIPRKFKAKKVGNVSR